MTHNRSYSALEKQRIDRELMPPPSSLPVPLQLKLKTRTLSPKSPINPIPSSSEAHESTSFRDSVNLDDEFETFISQIEGIEQKSQQINTETDLSMTSEIPHSSPWKEVLEPNTNKIYYWNTQTGIVSWEPPQTIPEIQKTVSDDKQILDCRVYNERQPTNTSLAHEFSNIEKPESRTPETIKDPYIFPTSTLKDNDLKIKHFAYQIDVLDYLCQSENQKLISMIQNDDTSNKSQENTVLDSRLETSPGNKSSENNSNSSIITKTYSNNPILAESTQAALPITENVQPISLSKTEDKLFVKPDHGQLENDESWSTNLPHSSMLDMGKSTLANEDTSINEKRDQLLSEIFQLLNTINKTILHNEHVIDSNYKQELKVQIDTRMFDWSAGQLSSEYFISKLHEAINHFQESINFYQSTMTDQSSDQTVCNQMGLVATYDHPSYDSSSALSYDPNSTFVPLANLYGLPLGTLPIPYVSTELYDYNKLTGIITDDSLPAFNPLYSSSATNAKPHYFSANIDSFDRSHIPSPTISEEKSTSQHSKYGSQSSETAPLPTPMTFGQTGEGQIKKKKKPIAPSLSQRKKLQLTDAWKKSAEIAKMEDEIESQTQDSSLDRERQEELAIEKWKEEQKASGAASKNVNFIPLGNDWRAFIHKHEGKDSD